MTCVCQDTGAIGREALEALHQLIESGPNLTPPARLKVRAWLEVHASTAPPPPGESA
jgi:DNA-binding LacI/PurR family transcriptional regulator